MCVDDRCYVVANVVHVYLDICQLLGIMRVIRKRCFEGGPIALGCDFKPHIGRTSWVRADI